jgi:hypothetical protein
MLRRSFGGDSGDGGSESAVSARVRTWVVQMSVALHSCHPEAYSPKDLASAFGTRFLAEYRSE